MHVLIVTPAFPPFVGGGERHTGTLAKQLHQRGHTVSVLTSHATHERDFWLGAEGELSCETLEPGLTIIRVPVKPVRGGWQGLLAWRKAMVSFSALPGTLGLLQKMAEKVPSLQKINKALAAVDYPVDVIHGFNISWEYPMMAAWRYAQEQQRPFVASPLAHLGTGPKDKVALNSTMRHQRVMLETADMLITNTVLEAQGLKERGVNLRDFRVAGPGVDIPQTVASFPEENLPQKPFVLFIGRATAEKGAIHAAQAVLKLRRGGSDIRLAMIGRGTDTFNQYYNDLSPIEQEGIFHLGLVHESLKHAYLKEARALLLPSRTDSFGIVLLESWLHGRPVIAANAGGIPAVVDDGQNGILVPYGDVQALAEAVRLLVQDSQLNQEMGEKGYQKLMARYTWEAVTDIVEEAYQATIASHSK